MNLKNSNLLQWKGQLTVMKILAINDDLSITTTSLNARCGSKNYMLTGFIFDVQQATFMKIYMNQLFNVELKKN